MDFSSKPELMMELKPQTLFTLKNKWVGQEFLWNQIQTHLQVVFALVSELLFLSLIKPDETGFMVCPGLLFEIKEIYLSSYT